MKPLELLGKRFGKLIIIGEGPRKFYKGNDSRATCICKCDCGNIKNITLASLNRNKNNTQSCGCYNIERNTKHGMGGGKGKKENRFYSIYHGMKSRCGKGDAHARRYYNKGIRNMRESFIDFRDDMYNDYVEHVERYGEVNTTLDRIDSNGNYCKDNCRRATMQEQATNKSTTILCDYNGEIHSMAERMRILLEHKI